jgi:hypothetical protein
MRAVDQQIVKHDFQHVGIGGYERRRPINLDVLFQRRPR